VYCDGNIKKFPGEREVIILVNIATVFHSFSMWSSGQKPSVLSPMVKIYPENS